MIYILSHYQDRYHPDVPTRLRLTGDGLTAMNAMNAILTMADGANEEKRFDKVIVDAADWHEHVIMLIVSVG